eukprot:TRINITY_DN1975_c0_g7_i2.p1 TRINITY_DN1975_c0_g7~~TRINITY_DN1975_c0_g7_i2.p1  ORF type:complete len:174 (-),score=38.85 TRINITY_DN1975_c0_g7_i2:911-1372(-)
MWHQSDGKISLLEQLDGLKAIWLIAKQYLLSVGEFRGGSDASLYSDRAVVMGAMLMCFDALLRTLPRDLVSPVTSLIRGDSGPGDTAYHPSISMYFGRSVASAMENMIFTTPQLVYVRALVLNYFQPPANRAYWLFSSKASRGFCGCDIKFKR